MENILTTITDTFYNITDPIREKIDTYKLEHPREYKRLKKKAGKALRYSLAFVCGFLLAIIVLRSGQTKQIAAMEQRLLEAQQTVAEKEPTPGQLWSAQNEEYKTVARAIHGIKKRYDLSDTACCAYIDVIRNRANPDVNYDVMAKSSTLMEALAVPDQWELFDFEDKDGVYTQAEYNLVKEYLESGAWTLNSDRYFWVEVHNGYIIAKDSFNGNGNQQKVV